MLVVLKRSSDVEMFGGVRKPFCVRVQGYDIDGMVQCILCYANLYECVRVCCVVSSLVCRDEKLPPMWEMELKRPRRVD